MDLQNIYNRGSLPLLPTLPSPNAPLAASVQPAITLREHSLFERGIIDRPHDDLQLIALHLLFYDTEGDNIHRKENLFNFSGFPPGVDLTQKVYELVHEKFWTTTQLRATLKLFGLAVRGTREEMSTRLVRYLCHPYDVHKIGTVVVPTASISPTQPLSNQPQPEYPTTASTIAIADDASTRTLASPQSPPQYQHIPQSQEMEKNQPLHSILERAHHTLRHAVLRTREMLEDEQIILSMDEIQHCRMMAHNMAQMTHDLDTILTNQELTQSTAAAMIYNVPSATQSDEQG